MNESLLNRILKDHKRRTRSLALILCLSMIVSLGTFAGFHKTAIAKVYTREVLDCPYAREGAEPVAHVHNDDCYEGETLVCTLPEREAHTHDDTCYAESRMLSCGLEENPGHQHSEECFDENGELICQIPEGEGAHVHTDDCYTIERALVCNQPELPVHIHDAGCFRTEEITVDEPEETAASEQAVSTVPEMPVSDPNADLETVEDWNREFENLELSGNWARDLVLVAATQQGRGESPNNFEAVLNDAGDAWVRHGYTRYGAWYGYPYAEWDAMFVSFCLRYAGIPVENVPNNPTAAFMAESFSMGGLFAGRDYIPAAGDLIFFDTVDDEITNIDHMGIVYHVDAEDGTINTVEGDRADIVATFGYYLNDEQIVGYGILPQNPNYVPNEDENTDNTDEALDGLIFMTTDEEEEKQEETTSAEEAPVPEVPMPAQSWERTAGGIKVTVEAPEGAFPENTQIAVTPVNGNSLKDTVSDAVDGEILEVQAVDITFFTAEGREIEPATAIRVVMTPAETQNAEEKANVVHVNIEQQTAELIEQAEGTEADNSEVVFDAEAFTIYAIVYTVDFEYEVNGKTFTSSMPGAEDMPLSEIVKGLGIVDEEELETFLSKIVSVTSTNEEVAVVTEDRSVRVLKDGDAQIVITMQDGAKFKLDVKAEGETSIEAENVAISTINDLYLPEKAEAKAEVVDGEEAIAAVQRETGEETEYTVFDISLENVTAEDYKEGFKVEVALESNINGKNFRLYHVHDGETTDITESLKLEGPVDENGVCNVSSFSFHTDGFSEFVLSYTVDFHWEVNGKVYEFSIPGGGFISLEHIVEALGLGTDTNEYTEAELDDASDADSTEATEGADVAETGAVAYNEAIQLNEIGVSEATKQFVADVVSVEFSSPELVWVGKINEAATVGGLKEANELEVEYSADLTEEQIAEINAQTVEAGDWALVSVRPFVSEESLTVTMENGDSFTIRVTDGQIRKTVIDAKGDTWEIMVTYGDDAQIPDGAELNVREILPTDEEYEALYNSAAAEACSDAEKQGIGMPVPSGARLFDIEILGEDGKIEPSAPVQVSIRLVGAADADYTAVVHFGVDGAKALTAQTSEVPAPEMQQPETEAPEEKMPETRKAAENTANETVTTEVVFQADSFSVYTVVNVTDFGSIAVSDKKYALVTGIANDPGATTGYSETWGRDYFTIIVNAHAMSDQHFLDGQNRVDGFQVQPVHAYEDGGVSYVGGSPAQWQFESAGNGKYYLSVNGKYLQRFNKGNNNDHQWGWEARLVDNRNEATQLSINVNSDGTILIHDGGFYLHNDGTGEWAKRVFKFRNDNEVNTNSAAYRFRVCEESELFDSFAARKVSIQDLTVNDGFLIYRKFEDSQGNEQLYALASDGTFVRVYDGGDTVYWRETDKNLYWNYRLEGGYYSIYSTDPETDETVYINPMHSEPSQTISTEPSRLTLIGKDNGEYGTALENWDQTAYDYAGLHVTLNDQGVPVLSTGTRVAGTSDEFLFAVASNMPADAAEKVETVDSEALGIHITVFDYGRDDYEYNAGDKLDSMADVVASNRDVANSYQPHQANALVKPYLESGLPSGTTTGAMTGLFTPGGSAVTYSQSGVTNLFLKSYYDESGMFRYRSEDNFAYLGKNGNTSFTVYRQAATPYPYDTAPGHTYYTHGHYMPFNDIDMTTNVSRLMNQYGNDYQNGQAVGELPVGDGRTYEDIYGTQGIPNFFTGLKMEADFTQLKDGRLENGDPMVFKFTGDDDMWVYIDGVLVLDIGGIHEPLSGTIDFSTGNVNNPTGSSLAGEKTLYQIFMAVLNNSSTPQDVKDRINAITWKDVNGDGTPDTFADYTNHDFKAFYMERGAGASNLDIQFNLKVVRPGEVVVEKQVPEGVDPRFVNQKYKFQATFKDYTKNDEIKPLYVGATYGTEQENIACTAVFYKDRKDDEGNPVPVTVDENGCFTLKAGEAAVFMIEDKKIEYTIKEVEINSEQTRQVEINGQVVTVSESTAEAAYARVQDRSQLKYKNHPYLQNLNITKHLLPEGTQAGSGDVFEFRVYLESTVEVEGAMVRQLIPYSYGPYYVTKEVNGVTHYYTLTGTNNAPVDKGTDPVVCSTTGRSGSINSIPPEYTVVIPNLAVGTHFYVEERRDNIPAGFVFDHEELVEETYDLQTLGSDDDIISRILARDEQDHQAFDPETIGRIKKGLDAKSEVYNKKVCVNVQKQWLRMNGQPYTLEEARQLPGSTDAVITAELWKKQTAQETGGETEAPVTVTFMVNTTEDSEYRQVSVPVTIKKDSTLEFSLGARGTSQAQEIHTDPEHSVSRSSVSSNPKITYSNGRQKDKWSKYTISGIAENTTVYATFDAAKVSDDFVGLYIASMEEPGASATPVEEKVADITLNNGNDWMQQIPMEQGYTYFLMNVVETGLESYTHQYSFISAPAVTTDQDGNLILAVANKYREPINITVEKVWSPALSGDEEDNAYVTVELHRYAKKTKGVFEVVLKDNYGAPIEGAVFKLYKDGVAQEQDYTTDVNGRIAANNLEPGTYYFKQISTPEGYSMSDSAPQTEEFAVKDNQTVPQEKHCELQNQALETNGVATLTLLDNKGSPIPGAKYNLLKREGSQEEVIREGLLTDANGTITVSQLRAGTYYFFETEPPAAYKLPDNWQDTDFTVLEHPGTVQYFNLSMTNDLKGKGYVEVTLTGPGGQAVSGAMFELYRGSEKQAEGSTGPDGKLTFGDPERLAAGTYTVKQVTSDAELLPAGAPQEFTILENGDPDQKKELSFTNPYRGKGTATVTLTRKDNGAPISGATFELYKDGSLFVTKTTDTNGQLTFGDPDKLTAGNYSIKQVSTEEGLEPVITNDSFAILENGNPNQTHSWTVQNEANAGNVTIKLWKKQGLGQYNWEKVGNDYINLKLGKTYSFTAELNPGLYPEHCWFLLDESENNYNRDLQAYELTGISGAGTWDSTTNTYHFTITPEKDNTTYSYVLATDWGSNDIKSITMDEGSRSVANGARMTVNNAASAPQSMLNVNRSASSAESSSVQIHSASGAVFASAPARNAVVSPSGPPSDDYIVDSTFTETYTIRKSDNWQHVFENLDKYDLDENPYYYYVVETECVPDTYHLVSYGNDNLTDTGTITVTNQKEQKGSLSVTKSMSGLDPEAATEKIYQIGVKDSEGKYYSLDGLVADSSPYYVTFTSNETKTWNNLPAGSYTVEENQTAAEVEGYTLAVSGTESISVTGGGTSSTTVTNTYTRNPGDLELTKKVSGDGAETDKEFEFTIDLTAPNGKTLAETYQYTRTGVDGAQTLTLVRTDDNTKASVTDIKLKANEVYTIIGLPAGTSYKITESDYSDDGYSASTTSADPLEGTITGGTKAKESVEVTNTFSKGGLTVEKAIRGKGADPDADFDFQVTINRRNHASGNHGTYKIGNDEYPVTFTDGTAVVTFKLKGGEKAEFSDLQENASFVVEETSADQNGYETTVTSTGGTVTGKTVTGKIGTEVAITAVYTNTRETTTVEAVKEWKTGEQTVNWPEDVDKIEFTLYKTVNGQTSAVSTADVAEITNPVEINSATEGKKAVWSNLPTRYLVEGTWYDATYTVKETRIVYNEKSGKAEAEREVTVDIAATANAEQAQGSHQFTVTNELEPISIHVTKEWKNKDDQILDGTTGKEIPSGAKVTFTLYNGDNAVTISKEEGGQTVTINRSVDLSGTDATSDGTVNPTTEDYEVNWVAYFTNLPKYDADGKIIEYTVRESGTWTGYEVSGSNNATNDGKITNKEKTVTLDILKVQKNKETPLENATFKLWKIDGESSILSKNSTTEQTSSTNAQGKASFGNLTIGYYIITETNPPAGYVITGDDSFYIEVTDNGINLLIKGEGAPSSWTKNAVTYGNVKTFTAATTDSNAQAKVENTPGTALPMTGGSGTGLFTILGSILIAGAGLLLWRRRRLI